MFVRINLKIATLLISILFILCSCFGSKNLADKSYKMNTDNHYKTLKIKITKEAGIAKSGLADSLTVTQKALVKNDKIPIKNKYPSPFCPSTTVNFEVVEASEVTFELFNAKGILVGRYLFSKLLPGKYKILFNSIDIDSGLYYYRLLYGTVKGEIRKIILLK